MHQVEFNQSSVNKQKAQIHTGKSEWTAADSVADCINAGATVATLDSSAFVDVALTSFATVSAWTFATEFSVRSDD